MTGGGPTGSPDGLDRVRLLPAGEAGFLVDVVGPVDVVGASGAPGGSPPALPLWLALQATRPVGVLDLVPAERSVLVTFDPALTPPPAVAAWIRETAATGVTATGVTATGVTATGVTATGVTAEPVTIDVRYDGADLAEVARLTGLTPAGVADLHTATGWTVAFGGFAPGFGYLVGGDPRLEVPRRPAARPRVPAGAVALAARYTGVYPRPSPGGWQIIGTTAAPLWDADRDPPALLRPGVRVRFRQVG